MIGLTLEKLDSKEFPKKKDLYNILKDENISQEDYNYFLNVLKVFNIQTFREYHDLYMMTDVLLLSDVFENFQELCLKIYGLDPAWYFTSPSLAWDAMLKKTKVELELIHEPNMYLMIENGIRGGISTISMRIWKKNIIQMKKLHILFIYMQIIYMVVPCPKNIL